MQLRRRKREEREQPVAERPRAPRPDGPPPEELVRLFLRGQNLEQVRLVDEAIEHYEQAVAGGFDAIGPYDRLIAIYAGRNAHRDIIRVAEAALSWARTYDDKRAWYERVRAGAEEALRSEPDHRGAEF
jgi:hypothetical protein